jgi:hypothetical protein
MPSEAQFGPCKSTIHLSEFKNMDGFLEAKD